jgi:hypothetical protein
VPVYSTKIDEAAREIAEVENALRDGHPPKTIIGSHQKSAVRVAAERLSVNTQALRGRIGSPDLTGYHAIHFGLSVDWDQYRPRPVPEPEPIIPDALPIIPEPPADHIGLRRAKDDASALRARIAELERRVIEAEDVRAGVLGLVETPLRPRIVIPAKQASAHHGRTVILHLSDVHYGETVELAEMDGANRYDAAISRSRLGRFFGTAADLMTKHWIGPPPDEVVLCLGGDLISGDIHPELAQTNFPSVPATVKEVGEHIAGGIVLLHKRVGCPLRVLSVPGNHGRMTVKPQSKRRSAGSLDLLASDFAEAAVRGAGVGEAVQFFRPASPDAHFSTYGWHWLLTHGDAQGAKGGTGYIGPIAAITKGHRKLVDTSWRSGHPVHFVLTGHFHTTAKTPFGWANGSVVGYGEYARDLRADPEPARQNLLVVHPRHGVINEMALYLGAPGEGSLYAGPASLVRPSFEDAA